MLWKSLIFFVLRDISLSIGRRCRVNLQLAPVPSLSIDNN